jgi:hypothetical protein
MGVCVCGYSKLRKMTTKRQQSNDKLPFVSEYLLSVDDLENIIKKPKSSLGNIATNIIIDNENIFSFNKKNIDNWCSKTSNNNNNKKVTVDINSNKVPHNTMKNIIKNRKTTLQTLLKNNLDDMVKSSVLEQKKYNEYITHLDHFIQNLLKFEFLGLCVIKIKKYEYPLFCYYYGKDNTIENLSKKTNWKILPSSLVDLFHTTYKKTWLDYLKYDEDHYNINNNMEQNNTFKLLDTIKPDQLKLIYHDDFLIPKLIDHNKDKYNIQILKYDLRFFTRKYRIFLNSIKPKQPKKRKISQEDVDDDDSMKEEGKEDFRLPPEDEGSEDNRKLKKQKISHCAYGFNDGLILTNEKFPNTIEDWKNKKNIIPPNIETITMLDVKDFVKNKISKNTTINMNSGLIPDILINAFNPLGVVTNCIRFIGLKKLITIQNDNNQLSGITEKLLDDPNNHEDIRKMLYSHFNSIIVLSVVQKKE